MVGLNTGAELEDTNVPLQIPVYQFQTAPVPSEPPTTERVVDEPAQTGLTVAFIEVGAVEFVFTFTVSDAQIVVLHVPTAAT